MQPLRRFADYLGAQNVPDRAKHERDRALWRAVFGIAVASFWLGQHLAGREVQAWPWFAVFLGLAIPALALAYRRFLATNPQGGVAIQYAFLILDPVAIVGTLLQDPRSFAFLHPVMMIVLVGNGIRFGVRTMHFAFGVTLALCTLLVTSAFWRADLALTASFLLSLAFVPVFFSSLVRRLHSDRANEEERARATAANELALARSAFLAKVSHELRSPLQGIVSALDVIEMRHAHALAGDEELIGRMRRSSMLLNTQLRDLLTLAKGEAGRLADPRRAVRSLRPGRGHGRSRPRPRGRQGPAVAARAAAAALVRGGRCGADRPGADQPGRQLDPLHRCWRSAGRAGGRGQPAAASSLRRRRYRTGHSRGRPADLLQPDRSVSTSARRGEGSGIGLAIVRTLVDHLGGTLRVTSAIGRGTTFSVEIPAGRVRERTATRHTAAARRSQRRPTPRA